MNALVAVPPSGSSDELTVKRYRRELTMLCDELAADLHNHELRMKMVAFLCHDTEEADRALARLHRRETRAKTVRG